MNNIIIGKNSGIDLTNQSGYFIIGDNISIADVDSRQARDVVYFDVQPKICIAKDMLSEKALKYLNII